MTCPVTIPDTSSPFSAQERQSLRLLNPSVARDRIRFIAASAAQDAGVKLSLVLGDCRLARVVRARDMVIAKAASEGIIDEVIAAAIGMDRSSVWSARRREAQRRGQA